MKKVLVLVVVSLFIATMIVSGCGGEEATVDEVDITTPQVEDTSTGYMDVTAKEANDLINQNGDLLIIDVSPKYAEGHLLDSVNYYVGDGSLDDAIPMLDKDKKYLVYCHVDSASISGSEKLVDAGFENVYRLQGNYQAWIDAGYPVIQDLAQDPSALKGALGDVTGGTSSGEAFVLRKDGQLMHKVTATLPDPPDGEFYEGWLVGSGSPGFFSTGKMVKTPDGSWLLEYVSAEEYQGYNEVVITVEKTDDQQPESHVIEGTVG